MGTLLELLVVLLVLILVCDRYHVRVEAQSNTSFSFPSFVSNDGRLWQVDDISYNSTLGSFDMNYRSYATGLLDEECGRLLYKDRVRMVDRHSGRAASFNTSFTFAFLQQEANSTTCGAGMVFTFVGSTNITPTEYKRRGKGMCVFDSGDTTPANSVLAVKFDSALTNLSGFNDPSDSNIGVIVSRKGNTSQHTYNLCGNDTKECAFFCGDKGEFTAWVDYDSVGEVLEVRFRNGSLATGGKPVEPVIRVTELRLDGSVLEYEDMYVGFSGSTFWSREIHRIRAWSFNSSAVPNPPRHPPKPPISAIIGIACAGALGVAFFGIFFYFFIFRHKNSSRSFATQTKTTSSLSSSNNTPRAFTYRELKRATKNFSDSELLSGGSFGDVFKGTLPSGALVAVKRIKNNKEEGEESFLAEATSLRQIRHRHLLQLRGWCQAKERLLLVYDFLSNGSLDKWLHPSRSNNSTHPAGLPWNVRRNILAGVASGLAYLHEEWVQCILHRDVKSSNVMLDADFNAYLGDFGLARLIDHHKLEKTTLLAGTLGYMAPEMQYTGRATKETDVYAFGILLLEVVCGRRPLTMKEEDAILLDSVWRAHEAGNIITMADPKLVPFALEETKTIVDTLRVGLFCCLPNPSERPSMRVVNQWLQQTSAVMELPALPNSKPYSQYSVTSSSGLKSSPNSNGSSFQTWPSSEDAGSSTRRP